MELTMSYIIKEKDGNIRDLTKNPHGAGYCNNCQNWLNYGCLKNQNPQLCMVKEPAIFEQSETRLTYPKIEAPRRETTIPKNRPEQSFITLVAQLNTLADSCPEEYCKVVRSGAFTQLLKESEPWIKELGLKTLHVGKENNAKRVS
jgi:hypothetical protein